MATLATTIIPFESQVATGSALHGSRANLDTNNNLGGTR